MYNKAKYRELFRSLIYSSKCNILHTTFRDFSSNYAAAANAALIQLIEPELRVGFLRLEMLVIFTECHLPFPELSLFDSINGTAERVLRK